MATIEKPEVEVEDLDMLKLVDLARVVFDNPLANELVATVKTVKDAKEMDSHLSWSGWANTTCKQVRALALLKIKHPATFADMVKRRRPAEAMASFDYAYTLSGAKVQRELVLGKERVDMTQWPLLLRDLSIEQGKSTATTLDVEGQPLFTDKIDPKSYRNFLSPGPNGWLEVSGKVRDSIRGQIGGLVFEPDGKAVYDWGNPAMTVRYYGLVSVGENKPHFLRVVTVEKPIDEFWPGAVEKLLFVVDLVKGSSPRTLPGFMIYSREVGLRALEHSHSSGLPVPFVVSLRASYRIAYDEQINRWCTASHNDVKGPWWGSLNWPLAPVDLPLPSIVCEKKGGQHSVAKTVNAKVEEGMQALIPTFNRVCQADCTPDLYRIAGYELLQYPEWELLDYVVSSSRIPRRVV